MQMADYEESPFESGKILVRDLAPNTTRDDLIHYFTWFGNVSEAVIPHNSVTGSPHSFGFVVFKQPFQIPFILPLTHSIHDRCVEVSRALKGEDLQTLESQRMTSTGDDFERLGFFDKRRIFVYGRPSAGITEDGFLKYFQGFGNVINCYFWNDLGYGDITFKFKRDADRVLVYRRSYILINGNRLNVGRLKHIPIRVPNDSHTPNVSRAINIQDEAAAGSGGDHVNNGMQPQAAASVSDTRNAQIVPAAASSATDDHVNSTTDMQPQAAESVGSTKGTASSGTDHIDGVKDMQILQAARTDHVISTRDMQPQDAESVSNNRDDGQTIPTAADSGPRHMLLNRAAANFAPRNMQTIPVGANFDPRNMQIIPAGASSGTAGHAWNNSFHANFPPSGQRILHYHPQMNYMVPVVLELPYPGFRPALYQAHNGMGIFINAANSFPRTVVANFPPNYAGYGNFPMALTDYADQDFNNYDNSNG